MGKKTVEDYLTEGIYGTQLPKQGERNYFLGTLRERIVIALKTGQVMTDKGLDHLEQALKKHPEARLIFNGRVANKFLKEEKELAEKYNVSYTVVTNEEADTDIGAVLTYDHAIDQEEIFITDATEENANEVEQETNGSEPLLSRVKKWFS